MCLTGIWFFVPQMVLSVAVSGFENGDIPSDASLFEEPLYDRFFTQFKQFRVSADSVSTTRRGTLFGAYTQDGDEQWLALAQAGPRA